MKEKAIEKIPYIGLQKISRIKSVKYIGVTAVKNIGHQRHLLLEVYENKKKSKKIPVVRIALTKKDFGTYWPSKQIWTRQQVSAYKPIWMEGYTRQNLADENILQSQEDLARIKSFCGTKKHWRTGRQTPRRSLKKQYCTEPTMCISMMSTFCITGSMEAGLT